MCCGGELLHYHWARCRRGHGRRGRVHHGGGRHRHVGGHPSYVWHRRRAARWLQASAYFTVGPDEFTLCSGIFNKKQVRALPARAVGRSAGDALPAIIRRVHGFHRHGREARRTRPSWCPTSPRPRPSGCAPSSTTARTLWPLRLPLRRAWRVQRVRPRRVWRAPPDSAVGGGRHCGYGSGGAAACRSRPPQATCSDVGAEVWVQVGGVFAGLLRIPAALHKVRSHQQGAVLRGVCPPHRYSSSSPVWLSACCKSSVSSST